MRFVNSQTMIPGVWLMLATAAIAVCIGCGRYDARVSGTVTLDGKVLDRGIVAYYPESGGVVAYGVIDGNGEYHLMTGRDAGLPPGEYDVTVVANEVPERQPGKSGPPPPGKRLTAESVSDRRTTDLHYTVEPGGNVIDLELFSP